MCFSSPQERQLHNEKCVCVCMCVCVCVCVCWGGQDQRCTYSVWCLEMGKCRHISGVSVFAALSLVPPRPALRSPWLQPCLLGLRESLIPSGGDSDGAKFPLCSSQNFHFRMQAIPSRTWLKINLKKKEEKKKKKNDMRCRRKVVIQGEGGRVKWTDVEKLFYVSFSSSRYLPNVADCTVNYSDSADFHLRLEINAQEDRDWVFHAFVSHLNTSCEFYTSAQDKARAWNVIYAKQTVCSPSHISGGCNCRTEPDQLADVSNLGHASAAEVKCQAAGASAFMWAGKLAQ